MPKRRKRTPAAATTTPVPRYRQTELARTVRRNRKQAAALTKPAKPTGCQHPKSRARGMCQCDAITHVVDGVKVPIEFDIPPTYQPETRHANQPDLPRPRARLCTQHKFLVDAHATGDTGSARDYPHRLRCAVCAHPDRAEVERAWVKWGKTSVAAAEELGVSVQTWNHHCEYYGLDEKKLDRKNTMQHLRQIAERGGEGRAGVKDALGAHALIAKQRGDVVNVNAQVVTADVSQMSTLELAQRNAELAKRLAALEAAGSD